MKHALIELDAQLPDSANIISTVHDEIIVEVQEADAEAVRQITKTIMEGSMVALFPEVPIEVDVKICMNWGEK